MMERLVFRVIDGVADDDRLVWDVGLEEPPVLGRRTTRLRCTGNEPEFTALAAPAVPNGSVRTAGRTLYDAIAGDAHLSDELADVMRAQLGERRPVFVEFAGLGAESLPWEALCSPKGDFLGIDERWAIGRLVESLNPLAPVWALQPPLKIAAVLSSLDVPAEGEWTCLRDAVTKVDRLDIELLVLVSEDSLFTTIEQEALPGVRVELVPDSVSELQRIVAEFGPHVIHFFCHGSSGTSKPNLQIATKRDWIVGNSTSSLIVEARQVNQFTNRSENLPWLVVLNCCKSASAEATQQPQRSVALDLVYEGGVPAVVGMREPVGADDATLFTGAFYTGLLRELARRCSIGDRVGQPVDWALLVVAARARLAAKHPGAQSDVVTSHREWTMPVVYTRTVTAVGPPMVSPAPHGPHPPQAHPGPHPPPAHPGPPPPLTHPGPPPAPAGQEESPPASAEPPPPLASAGSQSPLAAAEQSRRLRLEIEALTGLLERLATTADQALAADVEATINRLRSQLAAT
jgi:hypothetical protein